MALWCVVPAAGKGLRVGGELPKQYLFLSGSTVIQHTLNRLSQLSPQAIVVPLAEGDEKAQTLSYHYPTLLRFVQGGKERSDSVLAGLRAIAAEAKDADWVLVHDVARPCVRISDIQHLLADIKTSKVGGLLAHRVRDTMKRAHDFFVQETVPREDLWHALTPQIFRYGLLKLALEMAQKKGEPVTDESQAIEKLGFQPLLVQAAADNIKITWPADIALAEAFLALQEKSLKE
jgi:2-C-methyl-D-erythritol 4-phosphate cytidylyltransferase